jgi:DNA (cytosine-5)-methyltransferase 1
MHIQDAQKHSAHIFAGAGGDICGLKQAGWHPRFAVEVNAHRCRTLRSNHPGLQVFEGPIQSLTLAHYPETPLLLYFLTFPCDRYTVAANVHHTWTGDALYLEALREIVLHYPELVVIENVYGLKKFRRVIETFRVLPLYHCSEFVLHGEDFSHQRKTRVFFLLHRQPYPFPPLEEYRKPRPGVRLADYLEMQAPLPPIPSYIYTRLDGGYRDRPRVYDPMQEESVNLFTNYRRDRSLFLVKDARGPRGVRPFTVREVANLHGFPQTYQFFGPLGECYDMVVDAVMPLMAYAIGQAANDYFAAIPHLADPPRALGHHEITSQRHRERELQEALQIVQTTEPLDPDSMQQLTLPFAEPTKNGMTVLA